MDKRFIKAIILGVTLLGTSAPPVLSQGLAGPYLAANRAFEHGSFDEAGKYFVRAMAADSTNLQLKQSAMVSFVAAGDFRAATGIAKVIRANSEADVFVNLVALVDIARNGDYGSALSIISQHEDHISPILWNLLSAWLKVGAGEVKDGLATFDKMSETDGLAIYGQYHKALALAHTGDFEAAADILAGGENGPLHLNRDSIIVHVELLSELGRGEEALQVLDVEIARGFRDDQ